MENGDLNYKKHAIINGNKKTSRKAFILVKLEHTEIRLNINLKLPICQ